ncbi:MAG TPA: amino acid adenylation domain-containing protein [Gemmatimonadales bacterium]|nr:amino acid adenylation domain-containing protein [Gemmatimonadales bacterium]
MTELLQQWVTRQAERRPDATALVMEGIRWTYGQLDATSTQLARILQAAGCARGDRVCILLPKSPLAVVSLLGILKADCIYIPIDTASPAARVAKIVKSGEPRVILAGSRSASLLDELLADPRLRSAVSVGWMEAGQNGEGGDHVAAAFSLTDVSGAPTSPLDYRNGSTDPAHILFTSGSTGTPKGVVITHGSVIRFVEWAKRYFGLGPSDRVSNHPPLHFDLSTFDLFGTFAAGAQVHLVPPEINLLPNALAEFIRASQLTQWFSVPSLLGYLAKFDVVRFNDFPTLRRLLWCGEVFPTPALRYWMTRLPHVTFTNLYGPTETTIASSYYTVSSCPDDDRVAIPIGTPCASEELLVLDEGLRPVPAGEVGDLYIRGVGLSPGYWRDPEKTRAAFVRNPRSHDPADRLYRTGDLARVGDDGLVYFLGRADSQIKSRGYRIELGEIETALTALSSLQECAVVAIATDGFEGTVICCAYVPAPGAAVSPAGLRKELTKVLPSPMLPSRWQAFERLPRNANGKYDRRALQEAFANRVAEGVGQA